MKPYRCCTQTFHGRKYPIWGCTSRLNCGTKNCHDSPTIKEEPLQAAILRNRLRERNGQWATGKRAAVTAAEFLQAKCPDRADFSPRNMRRICDFYRMYEYGQALLHLAMQIGWALNVVNMEAELMRGSAAG